MTLETVLLAVGPTDHDRVDELAEAVVEIAGPSGASVVLAHVFTPDQFDQAAQRLGFGGGSEASPEEVANRHDTIRTIGDILDEAGVEYTIRGRVGDHATEIIDLSRTLDVDRVVVGGRKRSPSGKAVFGSVAQDIMLEAPCPVTFVKAQD
ncbi:universal stress protein [Halorhabdus amylolytica]|uniref:universal stress protein n=1 Tax=Halorhabdus amylolytica TaxID=2559573 RepID=UPI0010AA6D27|nr:universal stress protein [Halorhabdus amylolytica]